MNLYGPHIHRAGMGLDLLERWKPSAALTMDVDSNYIKEARARSPNTTLVVRVYEDGAQFLEWSPVDWVNRLLAKFPNERPDFFVTVNEPFGHDSRELFARFDVWESEVALLLQAQGTDALCCNFGTGNFTAGANRVRIPDVFPRICGVARAMGPHDYSWPDLQAGWSWYAGRWFQWYNDILAATGKKMKFLIGECGLTQAIIPERPDHGWQSDSPENVTAESYLATLHWYLEQVVNWDAGRGIVLGLCLFNFYDQFHPSFEHIDRPEVLDAIIAMDVPVPLPEPPEPPNGGETMQGVKIYDFNNNPFDPNAVTATEEWLKSIFGNFEGGIVRHPIEDKIALQPGDIVFKLKWLDCKVGESSCVIHLEDVNGNTEEGKYPVFGWPTAEPHGLAFKPSNWTTNGDTGPTNTNGDVGPGMGTGAYYDTATERGPHFVWIWDLPSDMVDGIGMLTWHPDIEGNHLHVNLGFRAVVWEGEEPEPEPPTELLEAVRRIDVKLGKILEIMEEGYTPPEEPPVEGGFLGQFWNNMELSGTPVYKAHYKKIEFRWGEKTPPAPGVNLDLFSARFTGELQLETGVYTFFVFVDDGVRLWIDDNLIIDQWHDQAPRQYEANVGVIEGPHQMRMEYYERAGGATCMFWLNKVS